MTDNPTPARPSRHTRSACALQHLVLILSFFLIPAADCFAQGRHLYKPPPDPTGGEGSDLPIRRAGDGARMGSPGGRRGAGGGFTSKRSRLPNRGDAESRGWEEWWARNRYEFLEFPGTSGSDQSDALSSNLKLRIGTFLKIYARSDTLELRRMALIGLGRQKDGKSYERILKSLMKTDDRTARAAALAFGLAGTTMGCHALLHIAEGSDLGVEIAGRNPVPSALRSSAAIALGLCRAAPARPVLQSIVRDGKNGRELRAAALEGIGLMEGDRSLPFLIELCESQKTDEALLCTALCCLGKVGGKDHIPLLAKQLRSRSAAVRRSAALALGRAAPHEDENAIGALLRCYRENGDPLLKGFTLVATGRVGGKRALKELRLIMKRGTTAILPWAATGLGLALRDAPPAEPADALEEALGHSDGSVRKAAAIALGLAKRSDALPALVALLDGSDDPAVRGYCATALGMIGDRAAVGVLREALVENDPSVTIQAAIALSLLDDTDSAADMVDVLFNSGDEATKVMIARCLLHLADEDVAASIARSIETSAADITTRAVCIDLLSKLAGGRRAHLLDRMACGSSFVDELPFVEPHLDTGI